MIATDPLPLHHSWPLYESDARFNLGRIHHGERNTTRPLTHGIGRWRCDLATGRLDWSPEVHALFGLEEEPVPARTEVLPLYRHGSLDTMERMRGYAIRHRRGFTLDTRIATRQGVERWMRIIAMPVIEGGRVVTLSGVKQDVSHLYRR